MHGWEGSQDAQQVHALLRAAGVGIGAQCRVFDALAGVGGIE